ncbi:SusD/RagB family nutrient-binding outer membrane lipoprotein [Hymenobacter psychrotolerans]|uniref:Starch-binding associating with outer membrane n=1 Tax=Hymenobacter psychrotolerans DSM 18569 TaxID=1121959 RepID=A0A1M6TVU9_9BACT|nr:SusD/RagB family nutrient-binding outer membrane lipoprotein [Hymenobacter psychrotolerans]SHK61013.1 Starch-binding associating with outer membrane [Hymenobacter psychrotolerans DSM 18569]
MKNLLIAGASALLLTTSCVDSLDDDYNVDPKSPTTALASGFIANAERNLVRTVVSTNVNINPFRFYVQYWAATDYPTESRYDLNTRNIPTNFWNPLYRDVIRDLREAKSTINADINLTAAAKANQLAVAEVLEIYTWSVLVETFGNIPYSQALDFANSRPKYDDQAAIYSDLITRLDVALAQFVPATATGLGGNDLINGGNTALWIKFANAMKLRMALTIADVDPAKAKTLAESTAGKLPASNADVIDLAFNGTFPNTNPLYEDLVRSDRTDFVGTSFFVDRLKGTAGPVMGAVVDPRLNDYFNPVTSTTLPAGTFAGGNYGATNSKTTNSQPGAKLRVQTLPGVLMSYAQVEFMIAEAVARGYGSFTGSVASHYDAAITASILEWGGTTAEATAYLAQPGVAYATAAGDYKQKIGYQKWIALYNQPTEAWKEWRRLDSPTLVAPSSARSAIPVRLLYPVVEQNINGANYSEAAAAIGGDVVTTKLFWDKF